MRVGNFRVRYQIWRGARWAPWRRQIIETVGAAPIQAMFAKLTDPWWKRFQLERVHLDLTATGSVVYRRDVVKRRGWL